MIVANHPALLLTAAVVCALLLTGVAVGVASWWLRPDRGVGG